MDIEQALTRIDQLESELAEVKRKLDWYKKPEAERRMIQAQQAQQYFTTYGVLR